MLFWVEISFIDFILKASSTQYVTEKKSIADLIGLLVIQVGSHACR